MKTIFREVLPQCDICGAEANYDVPTSSGPWGNLCKKCFKQHAAPHASVVGTEFKKRTPTGVNADKPVMDAEYLGDPEDYITTDFIALECPMCREERRLEPDFEGEYTCENCKQKLRFHNDYF